MAPRYPRKTSFGGTALEPEQAYVQPTIPPEPSAVVPLKRGRGRPAKYDAPMSPAEQKRRRRAEIAADKERRDLMAQLLVIYRRMQPAPYSSSTHVDEAVAEMDKAAANIRKRQREFFQDLQEVSVEKLKDLLNAWTELPDSHGRLHNERSGEKPRQGGQSEIEFLASRADFDFGKVKPEGYGSVSDEDGGNIRRSAGSFSGHERHAVKSTQPSAFENRLYLTARWIMRTGTCPVCGFKGDDEHIWQKWFEESWNEQRLQAAHSADLAIHVFEELGYVPEHMNEVKKFSRKPLTFFRSVDDRNPVGEVTLVEIEDSIHRGWAFFSTRADRTEHLLPSQAIVAVFFGHFRSEAQNGAKYQPIQQDRRVPTTQNRHRRALMPGVEAPAFGAGPNLGAAPNFLDSARRTLTP